MKKPSCESCRKCGELNCGADTVNLRCYEPRGDNTDKEKVIKTIKRHIRGIEKAVEELENNNV